MELINDEIRNKTIYDLIFKQKNIFIDLFLMFFSVFFLAVLSNIRIPLWPVPITFQTFGIFLIAFFFGSRKGFLTILLYILVGLLGIGVFSGYNSGIAALIGPTGGYIIGFLFMVLITGFLIEKGYGKTKRSIFFCMLIGQVILYIFGLSWLWFYLGKIDFLSLLIVGFFPFLLGDLIKILIALKLFTILWDKSKEIYYT